jgi:SulP family sulfate permease
LIIFFQQVKDFLGLHIEGKMPAAFFPKLWTLAEHLNTINWWAFGVSASTLVFILVWPPSWTRRVPGTIVALVLATVISHYAKFPIDTLGSVFGGIPTGLPSFQLPLLDFQWRDPMASIQPLLYPAFTIALLCAIESLLSAVVADGVIDDHHNSNQEIIAQGLANIVCPFFGGIPATGAIARTATNIRSGATSPIAGMIHAIVLLIVILVAAPLATNIPLAALSAILIRVAYNIGEWSAFTHLNRIPRSDASVLVTTFILTVVVDLNIAVGVGMMLACLLFIKRISEMTKVSLLSEDKPRDGRTDASQFEIPKDILVFNVFGALMFGAAEKLETLLQHTRQEPRVLVLRMGDVLAMDATALKVLQSIFTKLRRRNKWLVLSGPHTQPYMLLESSGFLDELGRDNVQADFAHALDRAKLLRSASSSKTGSSDSLAAAKAPRG